MRRFLFSLVISLISFETIAQNFLPEFSVDNLGSGHTRISWNNPHGKLLVQLNVQRSTDSVRNFRTFFSPLSPELPQNGFVDNNLYAGKMYYRIFYVLEGGAYFFTKAKYATTGYSTAEIKEKDSAKNIIVFVNGQPFDTLRYTEYKNFRDSILVNTKDSLFNLGLNQILLKRYNASTVWTPSKYIFTGLSGYVNIRLPEAKQKQYKLLVFNEAGKKIFSIEKISETDLILDKTNFIRAGWFTFELYEDGKLKERNKFYLQKDF